MQTQILTSAVTKSNGVVTQIGRGYIAQPKTNFKGGEVKWYQDKTKEGVVGGKNYNILRTPGRAAADP